MKIEIKELVKTEIKESDLQFLGPTNHKWLMINQKLAQGLIDNYKTSKHLNRKPSPDTIDKYARDMAAGKWIEDVDLSPILIDKDYNLRGGLHRMEAFRLSGLEKLKIPVICPATEEEIKRQDTNRNRSQVNSNDMAMAFLRNGKELQKAIQSLNNLAERTIHTVGKILCMADNHPGLNDNNITNFKTKGSKKSFAYSSDEIVKSMEKYLPIFQEIDDHAFPFDTIADGNTNYARFAPFVAAFAKTYLTINKPLWKKMVRLLTNQINQFNQEHELNKYLASQQLIDDVFVNKTDQNNPLKVDKDMRRVLSCLAAAHNNVNVKEIELETYGYETFLK